MVNTSSGNGGLAPLPSTPQYAVTKAAVVTLTECLYAQLRAAGDLVGASVLFPGPHILRTGLFESWRTRPERFAKTRPRATPYVTVEQLEEQMRAAGIEPSYTEPADVAARVVDALRSRHLLDPPRERKQRRHHPGPGRLDAGPHEPRPTSTPCPAPKAAAKRPTEPKHPKESVDEQ